MEFNVALLLREPIGSQRSFQVNEPIQVNEPGQIGESAEPELGTAVDVSGTVRLLRTDRGILAMAALETMLPAECSRCLCSLSLPIVLQFEEEYYPRVDVVTGAPLPPPEDPTAFQIDEHHVLNLDEAIRQHLVLAEPMQPLCREECAGICPACGADRNATPCRCEREPVDSRWAALADLPRLTGTD